jgi:hypothetical protein
MSSSSYQPFSSRSWPISRHAPLNESNRFDFHENHISRPLGDMDDILFQDPWTPIHSIYRRSSTAKRNTGGVEGSFQRTAASPASLATRLGTYSESPEATSSFILDTARSPAQNYVLGDEPSYRKQGSLHQQSKQPQMDDAEPLTWAEPSSSSVTDHDKDLSEYTKLWDFTPVWSEISQPSYSRSTDPIENWYSGSAQSCRSYPGPTITFLEARNLKSCSDTSSLPSPESPLTSESLDCPECSARFTGKYGKGNLGRHWRHMHQKSARNYPCSACERVFHRQDARLKHIRRQHPDLPHPPTKPRSFTTNSGHELISPPAPGSETSTTTTTNTAHRSLKSSLQE